MVGTFAKRTRRSGEFAQGTLETVEFRDECPLVNPNRSYRKILMCWIRVADNLNVGDSECFPFILLISYGKHAVYWTPFIIASSKAVKDKSFICEMRFGPQHQVCSFVINFPFISIVSLLLFQSSAGIFRRCITFLLYRSKVLPPVVFSLSVGVISWTCRTTNGAWMRVSIQPIPIFGGF